MASSSNLVDNLAEGIDKIRSTNCNTCCLEYINAKDDLKEYKYLCCNKNYKKKFDENWKKRFANTYNFAYQDINRFILLLWKCVYFYEYMDDWEKFNKTALPEKVDFYSHFCMEGITDADYKLAKRVCKDFKIKHLVECLDLFVQSDTLLLAHVFNNFRNIFLKIYELDPARFSSEISMASRLKRNQSKIRSINWYW